MEQDTEDVFSLSRVTGFTPQTLSYTLSERAITMNDILINVDNRQILLDRLQKAQGTKVCSDEDFTYYRVYLYGVFLLYRQRTLRPDGRKGFMLTDGLAMVLGFRNIAEMQYPLYGIQYWRKFVSVERLRAAFNRYNGRI